MQCRRRLNGDGSNGDYRTWINLINTKGVTCDNKVFATEQLYDLLKRIVNETNSAKQEQFFKKYVKTNDSSAIVTLGDYPVNPNTRS